MFLFISLSQQNENKQREFELLPFWRVSCRNLELVVPCAWVKHAHSFCHGLVRPSLRSQTAEGHSVYLSDMASDLNRTATVL